MFSSFGAKLPAPPALLDFSVFLRRWGIVIVIVIVGAVTAFRKWKATPEGALAVDGFFLRAPYSAN